MSFGHSQLGPKSSNEKLKSKNITPFILQEEDNLSSGGSENIDEYIDNFRNRMDLPMTQIIPEKCHACLESSLKILK